MGRIVALVSGKGGVGKTTVTACLGAALSQGGHRVLMTDGDFGLRDLDLVVGKQNEVIFDSADACDQRELANEAIIPIHKNLDLLPASQALRWEDVGRKKYRKLIKKLANYYDYVLVDAPAGIGRGADTILDFAHRIIIVTQPLWVSLRNAGRVIQVCREKRQFDYAVVFNAMQQTQVEIDMETMMRTIGAEYVGTLLPYTETVIHYTQAGQLHTLNDESFMPMMKPLVSYIESGHAWEDYEILQAYESHKQLEESPIALFNEDDDLIEQFEKTQLVDVPTDELESIDINENQTILSGETQDVGITNLEVVEEPMGDQTSKTVVDTFIEPQPLHRFRQLLMRQRRSFWRRRR